MTLSPEHSEPLPGNIVLIGFMGSGKSTVGRILATRLGFQFVDTDALVVQACGMPISDLFAQRGEAVFRDYESQALASLLGQKRRVVATGGGVVTRESNRALLHQLGFVVGLTASEDVIFERVSRNTKRPLLQTQNPRATISKMLAVRTPLYTAVADILIETTAISHAQVATAIVAEAAKRAAL